MAKHQLVLFSRTKKRIPLELYKLTLTEDGKPPEWVQLIPAGKVTALDGRKFNNSNPQAVVDKFNVLTLDLAIDWEHSSQLQAPKGKLAPAAGWIDKMEVRAGSIWGHVEWTPDGNTSLSSKSYRYISPAFLQSKSGVVMEIVSAGLTNNPAIEELAAVAHVNHGTGDTEMTPEILAALGLSATATAPEVVAAIQLLRSDGQKMATDLTGVRDELTTTKDELATARTVAPSLDLFVPRADHDAVKAQADTAVAELASLRQGTKDSEIAGEIAAALKAGKITPATSQYHKDQCSQEGGLERFRAFVEAAPTIGDPSDLDNQDLSKNGKKKATAEQLAIAARCGVTPEQFAAAL